MVKVIHLADDGTEMAAIEVDDFTIEVIYAGIAEMLREAAASNERGAATLGELPATRASDARGSSTVSATRRPDLAVRASRLSRGPRRAPLPPLVAVRFRRSVPEPPGGPGRKGRAATLACHALLPGGHPRLPPGQG